MFTVLKTIVYHKKIQKASYKTIKPQKQHQQMVIKTHTHTQNEIKNPDNVLFERHMIFN